jgi:hypothetical protein
VSDWKRTDGGSKQGRVSFPPPGPLIERVVVTEEGRYVHFTRTGLVAVEELLTELSEAFTARFHRSPEPTDPIFWDASSSTPTPMKPLDFLEFACSVLEAAHTAPAIVHAVRCTGMVMTAHTAELFDPEDHDRFLYHVEQYLRDHTSN